MSHNNLNPSVRGRPRQVAIVLSNPAVSSTTGWPVGLWWADRRDGRVRVVYRFDTREHLRAWPTAARLAVPDRATRG